LDRSRVPRCANENIASAIAVNVADAINGESKRIVCILTLEVSVNVRRTEPVRPEYTLTN